MFGKRPQRAHLRLSGQLPQRRRWPLLRRWPRRNSSVSGCSYQTGAQVGQRGRLDVERSVTQQSGRRLAARANQHADEIMRRMTSDDLDFADALRALANWNQTRQHWQWLLAQAPDGCFIAETDGLRAG